MDKILAAILLFIFAAMLSTAIGAVMAFPVKWLWNWLFTDSTSILGVALPALDWFHAWALLALTGILIRAGGTTTSSKS